MAASEEGEVSSEGGGTRIAVGSGIRDEDVGMALAAVYKSPDVAREDVLAAAVAGVRCRGGDGVPAV